MSDFLHESVPRMPGLSMAAIEKLAEDAVGMLLPTESLTRPTPIDFPDLVEKQLPKFGILVYPASAVELADQLAATDPSGNREINILLTEELWRELLCGGRGANRARATLAHELGHAILHVPVIRRRRALPHADLLLNRVRRSSLAAYEDPEWQAWAFAGCLIAPRRSLQGTAATDVSQLAAAYGISEGMMKSHIKRLKLQRRFAV